MFSFLWFYRMDGWVGVRRAEATVKMTKFPCCVGQNNNPCLLNQLIAQLLLMYARIPLSLPLVRFTSSTSCSGPLQSLNYPTREKKRFPVWIQTPSPCSPPHHQHLQDWMPATWWAQWHNANPRGCLSLLLSKPHKHSDMQHIWDGIRRETLNRVIDKCLTHAHVRSEQILF